MSLEVSLSQFFSSSLRPDVFIPSKQPSDDLTEGFRAGHRANIGG